MGAFRSSRAADSEIVAAAPRDRRPRIVVIGGGASGALMTLALARHRPDAQVTLIEPSRRVGNGVAYGTTHPEHRLNVLPRKLSVFSDAPNDFAIWLQERSLITSIEDNTFVPRSFMGSYLRERLDAVSGRTAMKRTTVTRIVPRDHSTQIDLASGETIEADAAILATGHSWAPPRDANRYVPPDAPVTILGTGLTMVDRWLSLRASRHLGTITAISRHGLLPHDHGRCPPALPLRSVPFGQPVSQTMRWLRDIAAKTGDWRSAVDAIRPFTQDIWQSWSPAEQRRFLRHARRHWDIHRHRLAPDIRVRLSVELRDGSLRIIRSRQLATSGYVFDCRGYLPDWSAIQNPLIASLLRAGVARPDPLGVGLDVTIDCNLIDSQGTRWPSLFAIGPITRGRFWEIEAIPDIRSQCEDLATRIMAGEALEQRSRLEGRRSRNPSFDGSEEPGEGKKGRRTPSVCDRAVRAHGVQARPQLRDVE